MEFLDPKAERRHRIRLFIGYGLLAIAVGIGTLILLYYSLGYTLDREGEVQQSGIVFVSTRPEGATVTANGVQTSAKTNTKLMLRSGLYQISVSAPGYHQWNHSVDVRGGDLHHFTYPILIPEKMEPTPIVTIGAELEFANVSPNRRWVMSKTPTIKASPELPVQHRLTLYDVRNPEKLVSTELALPVGIVTEGDAATSWKFVDWAGDNRYSLIEHNYVVAEVPHKEFILVDRTNSEATRNLTRELKLAPDESLSLLDRRFDRYYAHLSSTGQLRAIDRNGEVIGEPIVNVLAFDSYGSDSLVYVARPITGENNSQTVNVMLAQDGKRYVLRNLAHVPDYEYKLAISRYDNRWYVSVADSKGAYLFRSPFVSNDEGATSLPRPWRYFKLDRPTALAFSDNSRYILAESGKNMVVYDAELVTTRRFTVDGVLDAPQTGVHWMDGYHMSYVSNGKLQIADNDYQNKAELVTALPEYKPFLSSNSKYLFTFSKNKAGEIQFNATSMIVEKN